ncbi:hypothetical protein GCM10029964_076570 [Kibdelosporangium lantanae]
MSFGYVEESDAELRYATLVDDQQLFRSLRMGRVLRHNLGFAQDPSISLPQEDVTRWMLQMIALHGPYGPFDEDESALLARLVQPDGFLAEMMTTLLVRRSDILPPSVVQLLVEPVLAAGPPWQEGVVVAVFNHPKLMEDFPQLRDPAGYSDRDAAWLLVENRFGEGDFAPGKELLDELLAGLAARFESWPW